LHAEKIWNRTRRITVEPLYAGRERPREIKDGTPEKVWRLKTGAIVIDLLETGEVE